MQGRELQQDVEEVDICRERGWTEEYTGLRANTRDLKPHLLC